MFKHIFLILFIFSTIFPQDICNGTCLSEEETENLFYNINKCESDLEKSLKINKNLNEQIYIYIQQTEIDSTIIENYIEQLKLKEDYIKELKPKWHENKYLWYSMGVLSMIVPIWAVGQIK